MSCAVCIIFTADVGTKLSVTGSNVGTAVKAEHQASNVEDGPAHPTERCRPASKWCMYYVSEC